MAFGTKAGVLFVATAAGGVLMDVAADRFMTLSPLSARIWQALSAGARGEAIAEEISRTSALPAGHAQAIVSRQLRHWEAAALLGPNQCPLPEPRPSPQRTPRGLPRASFRAPCLLTLMTAQLLLAERRYRRALRRLGLAAVLRVLQSERGTLVGDASDTAIRAAHCHLGLRRAFRQGYTASDCLLRSIALSSVLRRRGVEAELCIGVVDLPFTSHAWVEACGIALNESQEVCRRYAMIGRF